MFIYGENSLPFAIVAEAAARSPERDINILITMKCTRPARASNF